jgi:hypothetical protein
MRTIINSGAFFLLLTLVAVTYAGAPLIKVCVSDEGGRVAFKDVVQAGTPFVTSSLKPGNYVVQFNSSSRALEDNRYFVVVSAGRKKVVADSVSGEKFQGGIAVRVAVGRGLRITGQIAQEGVAVADGDRVVRVIDRERMRQLQDHGGEGSLRNHFAGDTQLMIGQSGRGY